MPQVQYLRDLPSWGSALGAFGESALGAYEQARKTREEEDALSALMERVKGKEGEDVLQEIFKTKGLTTEKKAGLADVFKDVSKRKAESDKARAEQESWKKQAKSLGLPEDTPPEIVKKAFELDKKRTEEEKVSTEEKAQTKRLLKEAGKSEEEAEEMSNTLKPVDARSILSASNQIAPYEKKADVLEAERIGEYWNEVASAGRTADRDLFTLDVQDQLSDEGATGFKLRNALADMIEQKFGVDAKGLRDPKADVYNAASKKLMGFMAELIKGKVSDNEFKRLSGLLSQAENSPKAAKLMNEQLRMQRLMDKAEYEIGQKIRLRNQAEGKPLMGPLFDAEVQKEAAPVFQAIVNQGLANMRNTLRGGPTIGKDAREKMDSYKLF